MKALLLTNDRFEDYLQKGMNCEERYAYFNPANAFEEIHLLYHDDKTGSRKLEKFNLHYRAGIPFIRELFLVADAVRLVKKHNIDVIRAYNPWRAGLIGALCKLFTKKSLVVSLHNDYDKLWEVKGIFWLFKKILQWAERTSLKACDEAWCVSNYLVGYARKRGAKNAILTPNKVMLGVFQKKQDVQKLRRRLGFDRFTLLFIGRMDEQKNIPTLLKAYEIVKKKHPIQLVILGRGPLKEQLLANADKDIIHKDNVAHDTELPRYFAASDAFVLPSLTEGFGVVLIEAQASGKPIIASDIPETKDIVNSKNALLFNPNSAEQFAEKIITLINDKKLRAKLSALSKNSAKKFEWKKLSKEEAKRYKQLVKKVKQ